MSEQQLKTPEQQSPLTDEVLPWVAHVANDERKLLILLTLANSDAPLSNSGVLEEMEHTAQSDLATERASINAFVKDNFYKVDAIEDSETTILRPSGHPITVPAYVLKEKAKELGIPLAGAILDWSYRHPDMSLKQVFGTSKGDKDVQSPLRRYYMLYDLITSPDNPRGPSTVRLAEQFGVGSSKGRLVAANRLVDFGWLNKETISDTNNRQFEIVNPEYQTGRGKRPFDQLKPETQLTFNALKRASAVKQTWGVDEFFAFIDEHYPDTDPKVLHAAKKNIRHALMPDTTTLRGTIQDASGKLYDDGGKVELKEPFQEAILELVAIIDAFCSGDQQAIAHGRAMAQQIVQNPQAFTTLFMKARETSNYANQDPRIDERIRTIIEGAGSLMTEHAIRSMYREETGRNITPVVIRESLARLVDRAAIVEVVDNKAKYDQRKVPRFGKTE